MMRQHDYYVYILTNNSHTLYVGVTNDLVRRIEEHRARPPGAFCTRYNIDTLVYYEWFQWIRDAIQREKQVKSWARHKKIALIEADNPGWKDLADSILATEDPPGPFGSKGGSAGDRRPEIPRELSRRPEITRDLSERPEIPRDLSERPEIPRDLKVPRDDKRQ